MDQISADVPEGCVIIREHIPITNLFSCLWFNEVDRFTSRDQLSFATVRDKVKERVNWNINMFLDCERRNFVIQVAFLFSYRNIVDSQNVCFLGIRALFLGLFVLRRRYLALHFITLGQCV